MSTAAGPRFSSFYAMDDRVRLRGCCRRSTYHGSVADSSVIGERREDISVLSIHSLVADGHRPVFRREGATAGMAKFAMPAITSAETPGTLTRK